MTPTEFRARAKECELLAAPATDPFVKRIHEEVAREWRKLADQTERHGLA
jgi:hypothetical protein